MSRDDAPNFMDVPWHESCLSCRHYRHATFTLDNCCIKYYFDLSDPYEWICDDYEGMKYDHKM